MLALIQESVYACPYVQDREVKKGKIQHVYLNLYNVNN